MMRILKNLRMLSYEESIDILSQYGIPLAEGEMAKSSKEAIIIANKIGYPVVTKIVSPQVDHKTDANALKLGIKSDSELVNSYHEILNSTKKYNPEAEIRGVLVQKMIETGVEIIVGVFNDPQFGPVILFGLGGIFVEALKDVSLRVPPLTLYDAEEMIKEIRGHKILEGFRGRPRTDVVAIIDILLKVSSLSINMKETISSIDLNPIIVQAEGKGAKVVDARFVVKE